MILSRSISSNNDKQLRSGAARQQGSKLIQQAQAVLDGKWKTSATWGGIKDGRVELERFGPALPNDVKQFVLAGCTWHGSLN